MGQGSSRQYPNNVIISEGSYSFTVDDLQEVASGTVNGGGQRVTRDTLAIRRAQIDNLFKKMRSNLKMYMLYDNFDSKNEVILVDLKKKAKNQEEELKQILESRDKLMAEFQTKKENTNEFKSKDKNTETINTILFLILIGSIIFIIYKLYNYPTDKLNNNNGVDLNKLLDLEGSNLNNLSEEELNNLEKAFDAKLNLLENNINNVNNSLKASNKSNSNKLNSSKSNSNSVNNITNSNIKKRNKLTLN